MLALLHTSAVHIPTFERLRDEEAPGLALHHLVDEGLLARARQDGPASVAGDVTGRVTGSDTGDLAGDVAAALASARAAGASAVLCTCSTIGGIAESAPSDLPVLRVDRPMAAAAVAAGPRIQVLAALASTVGPTLDLLAEEAAGAGRAGAMSVTVSIVDGAWARFEAGDRDGYLALIAARIEATVDADVIVLAQASMADAADLSAVDIPVLSSPRLGFRAAVLLARAALGALAVTEPRGH